MQAAGQNTNTNNYANLTIEATTGCVKSLQIVTFLSSANNQCIPCVRMCGFSTMAAGMYLSTIEPHLHSRSHVDFLVQCFVPQMFYTGASEMSPIGVRDRSLKKRDPTDLALVKMAARHPARYDSSGKPEPPRALTLLIP